MLEFTVVCHKNYDAVFKGNIKCNTNPGKDIVDIYCLHQVDATMRNYVYMFSSSYIRDSKWPRATLTLNDNLETFNFKNEVTGGSNQRAKYDSSLGFLTPPPT